VKGAISRALSQPDSGVVRSETGSSRRPARRDRQHGGYFFVRSTWAPYHLGGSFSGGTTWAPLPGARAACCFAVRLCAPKREKGWMNIRRANCSAMLAGTPQAWSKVLGCRQFARVGHGKGLASIVVEPIGIAAPFDSRLNFDAHGHVACAARCN